MLIFALLSFSLCVGDFSDSNAIDKATELKFTALAASLMQAAANDNNSIDEKERKLNEMITELELLRERLLRQVSTELNILLVFRNAIN